MDKENLLVKGLSELGLTITEEQIEKFDKYYEMLIETNKVMNLTSITEYDEVIIKHFIDSLLVVNIFDISKSKKMIDVGTGAGFPGIPIKIMFPHLQITLLDSLNKRINFLQEVSKQVGIDNIEFIHGRAEDFGKLEEYREKYDIATARAVAGLPILMEFCVPFVKVGGYFVCLKGPNANLELEESKAAMDVLGVEFIEKINIELPESDLNHNILVFKKVKNTPDKYPRKAGKPAKSPIK